MRKLNFDSVPEFDKEFKRIGKRKCTSINEDIEVFKKALSVKIPEHPSTLPISNLGETVKIPVYKVRRFRCRILNKGSYSGFRLIYTYIEDSSTIKFIQIYHKSNNSTTNHDKSRILKYCGEE